MNQEIREREREKLSVQGSKMREESKETNEEKGEVEFYVSGSG